MSEENGHRYHARALVDQVLPEGPSAGPQLEFGSGLQLNEVPHLGQGVGAHVAIPSSVTEGWKQSLVHRVVLRYHLGPHGQITLDYLPPSRVDRDFPRLTI